MTERQREIEKQRALDRAIDYEDRLVGRSREVVTRRSATEGARNGERSSIVTEQQYQRLIAATNKLQEAKAEVRAICAEIAAGGESANVVKPDTTAPAKGRRGGRRKAGGEGDAGTAAAKPKKEYTKKVKCASCGTVTGSQVVGDKRMPVAHQDPATGSRCKGIFMEAQLVTENQA